MFRLFLENERKRAERAGRSLLLVLVELTSGGEHAASIDSATAALLFSALATAVREVDLLGWRRAHRTVAAVLTQAGYGPSAEVSQRIGERVTNVLRERLPTPLGNRIEVRVLQLRAVQQDRHA